VSTTSSDPASVVLCGTKHMRAGVASSRIAEYDVGYDEGSRILTVGIAVVADVVEATATKFVVRSQQHWF